MLAIASRLKGIDEVFWIAANRLIRYTKFPAKLITTLILSAAILSYLPAVACPEKDASRIDFARETTKRVLETSSGQKYSCWWDETAAPITFQKETYGVTIRCSGNWIIYTHLSPGDVVLIEENKSRNYYQVDFLGDRYECDEKGQTMIKQWVYRRGTERIRQTDYYYYPYRW